MASALFLSPRGCTTPTFPFRTSPPLCSVPRWQIPCSQKLAASLSSLCALFRTPVLCFQPVAASFAKTPGVGVSRLPLRRRLGFDLSGKKRRQGDSAADAWRKTFFFNDSATTEKARRLLD